jgi:hypothetical protein
MTPMKALALASLLGSLLAATLVFAPARAQSTTDPDEISDARLVKAVNVLTKATGPHWQKVTAMLDKLKTNQACDDCDLKVSTELNKLSIELMDKIKCGSHDTEVPNYVDNYFTQKASPYVRDHLIDFKVTPACMGDGHFAVMLSAKFHKKFKQSPERAKAEKRH